MSVDSFGEQSPAIIALQSVCKTYGAGQRAVLQDVTLRIPARQFLAIVGPSGSGKTTLLRLINRLADPSSGNVHVDGKDVRSLDPILLRRQIGYVFQGVGLFPHMTVAENIAITPRLLGHDRQRIAARVDELLELVRLDVASYRGRFPHQLSGGERQRIGVARAIAANPHIVLMDEPFGALDPLTREGLSTDYRGLHDTLGLTTVMITHDMVEAVLLADYIAVLREGRLVAQGTPQSLLHENSDPFVKVLMQTPQRYAARLSALMAGR